MSNQEQQFYSAEHYPASAQPSYRYYPTSNGVNVDSREQQQQEVYDGEPEYSTSRGEKLQPHPPRRKGFRVLWLLPIVLLFLIGGMSYGLFAPHEQFATRFGHGDFDNHFVRADPQQVFKVGDAPTLIIKATSGTIHIHSDENSSITRTVSVIVNQNDRGNLDSNPNVNVTQDANIVTVTENSQGFGDNNASIDITTPKSSNVQLTDDNGDINIEDITGIVNAQTTKGRIDANDVNGYVTLSSTDGDVSLVASGLANQTFLHSGNGDIHFNGVIDSQGNYTFDTNNGSVDLRLPRDAKFHLDPHTTNGSLENDFSNDDVGSGTSAQLTVSSTNGSIHISKNG